MATTCAVPRSCRCCCRPVIVLCGICVHRIQPKSATTRWRRSSVSSVCTRACPQRTPARSDSQREAATPNRLCYWAALRLRRAFWMTLMRLSWNLHTRHRHARTHLLALPLPLPPASTHTHARTCKCVVRQSMQIDSRRRSKTHTHIQRVYAFLLQFDTHILKHTQLL